MRTLNEYIEYAANSLNSFIKESNVFEGGNAIPDAEPIPAMIAPKVFDEIVDKIHANKEYKDIELAALGSLGKKLDDQTHGDIDIAVRTDSKDMVEDFVNAVFGDTCYVNPKAGPNLVSIGYKYNMEGYKGVVQVDFMCAKNMNWTKAYNHSPNYKNGESKYKGAVRTTLLNDIISSIPVKDVKDEYFEDGKTLKTHWKHTFNAEGLFIQCVSYCGKNGKPVKNGKKLKELEQLVTNDPENMVKFVFGDNGTMDDINSAESLWRAVHNKQKWPWGDDVLKALEEKFINDPSNDRFDIDYEKDFPCQFYKK